MPVITCPGPGGPVTFSPLTYVTRHVRGGRAWPCPSPRPGHNQGTIPRTPYGATGANLRDSERISESQNYTT